MIDSRHLAVALAAVLVTGAGQTQAEEAGACPFTEDDVIGAWILPAPESGVVEDDAREFDLVREGDARTFGEFLHHRPMGDGTWRFDAKTCVLTLDYGDFVETFHVEGAREAHLVDESGQIYRRLAESAE